MNSAAGALRYTRDNGRFTLEQRKFYEDNGYLVLPKLIPKDVLERCDQRFEDIVARRASRDNMIVMYDVKDRKSVNKIQDFNRDPVLREYIEHKAILDIAETFCGPNILAVHTMLIAKPPDVGFGSSRHPPHQDLHYFPFRPSDWIVASWTAMEPCDVANGCLHVSPGSHKLNKLFAHGYPKDMQAVNKLYHGIQDMPSDMKPLVDLEMEPGDTVFFHPLLVHGSGVNTSNKTRKAISAHYASANCHYIEVEGTTQEVLQTEILEMVKRKNINADIKLRHVWQMKSTLVRGLRSNL